MAAGQLERIKIEGFRFIRALDLRLSPINILIGANGSGKSNFLSFFDFYKQFSRQNLEFYVRQQGGASKFLHFGSKQTKRLTFQVDVAGDQQFISLEPSVTDEFIIDLVDFPGVFSRGLKEKWLRYHFHDTSEFANIKKAARLDQTQMLMRDGENLAPFLHHIRSEAVLCEGQTEGEFLDKYAVPARVLMSGFAGWNH